MSKNNPSIIEVIKSVLASFFGVQTDENRRRDFEKGKPVHFIVVGLILTILFIVIVISIVKFVLYSAGL